MVDVRGGREHSAPRETAARHYIALSSLFARFYQYTHIHISIKANEWNRFNPAGNGTFPLDFRQSEREHGKRSNDSLLSPNRFTIMASHTETLLTNNKKYDAPVYTKPF